MLFFCEFLISRISFPSVFLTSFSVVDYMIDDTAFPVFVDKTNNEKIAICTRKTETPREKLLHGADIDKR